jgi:two-component system, chemotaxis family, chemotaxis protein CheY
MAVSLAISILVVDDSPTTVRIIRNLLARVGFRKVDNAPNGLDALVKMSEKIYHLIIADWNMEPMSGYELLKQIRNDPHLGRTPVILMTAEPRAELVLAAKKAGASNYISKPFTAEALKAKIESSFVSSNHCRLGQIQP